MPDRMVSLFPSRGRLSLREVSGSLGDLGTFIPLLLGLARAGGVEPVPALFWAGAFNVLGGLTWDAPMCVQPMKTIAAVGIAEGLSSQQVALAGMMTSAMVLLLGASSAILLVARLVPDAVVRGMQLGLGMSLALKGCALIAADTPHALPPLQTAAGRYAVAGTALCFVLASRHAGERVPSALTLFSVGVLLAAGQLAYAGEPVRFRPVAPALWALSGVDGTDATRALLDAALPQLPLTTLNSVVSVCHLAKQLAPEAKVTPRSVACSVGLINLLGCPFGAMPCCHGAGGLAAQHAFGARRGVSVLFLGGCKMLLALALGGPLVSLLGAFPAPLLGVMLLFSGVELARAGVRLAAAGEEAATVGLVTAAATLSLRTGVGCAVGLLAALASGGLGRACKLLWQGELLQWLREGDAEPPPLLRASSAPPPPAGAPAGAAGGGAAGSVSTAEAERGEPRPRAGGAEEGTGTV